MKKSSVKQTRQISIIGIMSAIGALLMLIEIPLPFIIPSFIKFDFSELPAMITAFTLGPVQGIIVCLLKNLIHLPMGSSAGVGELSNFILGAFLSGTAGLIYKFNKTRKTAFLGGLAGSVLMAAISFPSNKFIVYPFYYNFMPKETIVQAYQAILPSVTSIDAALLIFNAPFTLIKGLICLLIAMLVYKPLSPLIKGKIN